MPIDGSYIQNTIAANQAYFAAHDSYVSSMSQGPMPGGQMQPMAARPQMPPPPPVPPMPPSLFQTGLQVPPNMLQGMMYHPAWGSYPSQHTKDRYTAARMGDRAVAAVGSISEAASFGIETGAGLGMYAIGAGLGVSIAAPMAIGMAVKSGIDVFTKTNIQNYQMARQMQTEFESNPTLRRISGGGATLGSLEGMVSRSRDYVSDYRRRSGANVNLNDMFGVMSMGLETGQFDFVRNMEDYEKQSKKLFQASLKVSKILKTSLEEGAQVLGELRQMGFFDIKAQEQQLSSIIGSANMAGIGAQRMMNIAGLGAQITGRPGGAGMATTLAGHMGLARGDEAMRIARMGGIEAATQQIMATTTSQLTQTSMGTIMLANVMSGKNLMSDNAFSSTSSIATMLQRDPGKIAKLLTSGGKAELMEEMGENAPLINYRQTKDALEKAMRRKIDPYTYALITKTSVDEAKQLEWQSNNAASLAVRDLSERYGASMTRREGPLRRGEGLGSGLIYRSRQVGRLFSRDIPGVGAELLREGGEYAREHGFDLPELSSGVSRWWRKATAADYRPDYVGFGNSFSEDSYVGASIDESARRVAAESTSVDIMKRARDIEKDLFGSNDKFMDLYDSPGEEGKKIREVMGKYLEDPSAKNREHLKGTLLSTGGLDTSAMNSIMSKLDSPDGRSMLRESFTRRRAYEIKEEEPWREMLASGKSSKFLDKKALADWKKTGSKASFSQLISQAKTLGRKQMDELSAQGSQGDLMGGLISDVISGKKSESDAFKALSAIKPPEGTETTGGEGAILNTNSVNINGPKQIILNATSSDILKIGFGIGKDKNDKAAKIGGVSQ